MSRKFEFLRRRWQSAAVVGMAALALSGTAFAQSDRGYSTLDEEIFVGYKWFQIGQGSNAAVHRFNSNIAWGERLSEELTDYLAVEEGIELGYNRLGLVPFGGTSFVTASDSHTAIYAAGVLNFKPRTAKYRPFIVVGPEYVWFKAPSLGSAGLPPGSLPATLNGQGRTALTYGIGLKINSSPRYGIRFDLRGMRSGTPRFGLPGQPAGAGALWIPGGDSHESSLTASVGINFRFRYHAPVAPAPPPVTTTDKVSVSNAGTVAGGRDVCSGDDVRLTVSGADAIVTTSYSDNRPPTTKPYGQGVTYQWMVNGQPVNGATSSSFSLPTTGSGARTVTVQVSAGGDTKTSAPVTVNIGALTPPTISFAISPSTVPYGTKVNLNANATGSTCGGQPTVRYSGQGVTGNTFDSTALNFDMSNRLKQQCQNVTITATATDPKNQTASATAPVQVCLTAQARRLDDMVFPLNSSRVNNCAKRLLLEELTPMLRADPDAKVILIGHRDNNERVVRGKSPVQVDEARVLNSAAVLSAGTGICPSLDLSRILTKSVGTDQTDEARPAFCGTSTNVKERSGQTVKESDKRAEYRRVEVWIVPGGADMPAGVTGVQPVDATAVKAKGCPK
ncbi:MAG: hypothetical protein KGN84_00005 [Acidobacteriota bacterium]|nr:hypothetical protein [Acidobacteriota bacterium]